MAENGGFESVHTTIPLNVPLTAIFYVVSTVVSILPPASVCVDAISIPVFKYVQF